MYNTASTKSTKNTRETRILERKIERSVQQRNESRSAAAAAAATTTTNNRAGGEEPHNRQIWQSCWLPTTFRQRHQDFTNLAKKIKTPKKKSRTFLIKKIYNNNHHHHAQFRDRNAERKGNNFICPKRKKTIHAQQFFLIARQEPNPPWRRRQCKTTKFPEQSQRHRGKGWGGVGAGA